ncbi:hypothetical protein [Roseomonas elaeocarpi]|uniref:Uncharacterized protein n=1 Tax=Roseomonas elaeocarpi TaxID=907779 RepID=A0ABV6JTC7_9PROT
MRDLLRRLIDSLSELTHWLGDQQERQLSLGAVVAEVHAVASALARVNDPADLPALTQRLRVAAAATESEMERTVHDLDQARHAAFRATVLAAELTVRTVRPDEAAQFVSAAQPPQQALDTASEPAPVAAPAAPSIPTAPAPRNGRPTKAMAPEPAEQSQRGLRWIFGNRRPEVAPN